jgi:hypothetical protein
LSPHGHIDATPVAPDGVLRPGDIGLQRPQDVDRLGRAVTDELLGEAAE